jgi:hypothetical protein
MSDPNKSLKQVYDRSCSRPLFKSTGKKSAPSIKPSMLGSPCMRKVYYSYNKVAEDIPFPLENSRIANLGTQIGQMLADAFIKEGIAIKYRKPDGSYYIDDNTGLPDYEFRVTSPDLGVRLGKIDVTCVLDDGLWLTEIKSIHEYGYGQLTGPKPDHTIQGVLYLYLFNLALANGEYAHIPELANFKKANGIRFLYYQKNKSTLKEFVITQADDIFRQIVMKIQTVKDFSDKKVLPPKTEDYCKTCSWNVKCAKNEKAPD